MVRVAVVTALAARGTDEDEPLLLDALAAAGTGAEAVSWDDADVDWSGFDLAVLRSTWDHAQRHGEFLAWCRRVDRATRLVNPASVVAWNADKTYLRDLAGAGVPVVATTWVEPGQDVALPEGEVVVKPSISAGSRDTAGHGADERASALARVAALGAAGRTAMVQPYVASVDARGRPRCCSSAAASATRSPRVRCWWPVRAPPRSCSPPRPSPRPPPTPSSAPWPRRRRPPCRPPPATWPTPAWTWSPTRPAGRWCSSWSSSSRRCS